ncbi:three-Cys-motif partner protein TcmP [Rhodoferax sp. BLA1]|uniref:three-Cys-motif partner protein TcmP n=1 Tax=Rhodoferax sp. BLA1 TaxID=2576062 RepID=UPI0015D29192|nr:three-Cys-motif partner protein TcmP [Rhodoferax sp. BLA1]
MEKVFIPSSYDGREQAWIKHQLLQSYFEKLILIIGMSPQRDRSVEICYVDCFAGPWGDESESLESTSIAISLRTMAICRQKLAKLNVQATMRALYIEKDPKAFGRLSQYLDVATPAGVDAKCKQGDFLDLREQILDWCGPSAFVFFFIDPKGWKTVGIDKLKPLLKRPRSEFLINFIYDFINRTASMPAWQFEISEFLGVSMDVVQRLDGLRPNERERLLLDSYRAGLKRNRPFSKQKFRPRTAYVRVLDPSRDRPKYHLVYLTNHPKGVIEFMEISQGVDLVQQQVRANKRYEIRELQTGMLDMFSDEPDTNTQIVQVNAQDVDSYWFRYLENGSRSIGEEEFADILEQTDWMPGDLQSSLVRLIRSGQLRNLDAVNSRPKRPLHIENAERLELIPNVRYPR